MTKIKTSAMADNLEKRVADSMLHRGDEVKVGGEIFTVSSPVMETLILVSEKICEIPSRKLDNTQQVFEALSCAKDCRPITDAIAIIILGANGLIHREEREVEDLYLWGLIKKKRRIIIESDEMARVSKKLRYNLSNSEILSLLMKLLEGLQVADFFVLTSILSEINLMGRTRTQALGQ